MAVLSEVHSDIKYHRSIILGERKVGKTRLTVEIAKQHFGSVYKMFGISPLSEEAYEYQPNVVHSKPQTWDELMADIERLKTDPNFKHFDMVAIDTINEIVELGKLKVIDEYIEAKKKIPHSFQQTGWGGRGRLKVLLREFNESLDELLGEKTIVQVGHSKEKTMRTKLDDEEYVVIDASMDSDLYDIFAYNAGVIGNIVSEHDENGELTTNMYFRDAGHVKAGTRIATVPESIPFYVDGEVNVKEYINVVETAVEELVAKEEDEMPDYVKNILGVNDNTETPKPTTENSLNVDDMSLKDMKDEIIALAQQKQGDGVKQEDIMAVMNKHDTPNPLYLQDISTGKALIQDLQAL